MKVRLIFPGTIYSVTIIRSIVYHMWERQFPPYWDNFILSILSLILNPMIPRFEDQRNPDLKIGYDSDI